MKKALKITGIALGSLILLVAIIAGSGYLYLNSALFSFEKSYKEKFDFEEITIDGYTFLDRNGNKKLDIYEDARRSIEERVEDAFSKMTLDEKIHLLKGSGAGSAIGRKQENGIPGAVGTIVPTPRLGIPTVFLSDGPAGLRIQPTRKNEDRTYYCTAFPIGTLLSSTWNTELVQEVGNAMGTEAVEYGIDVILGPGANIHRHPFCGRNFEYYSEDPVLTGEIGAAMVNGIQSNGIGTAPKHYVANNQETNRNFNDTRLSERALREIYLKGFEIITKKSQPWTIMSSYNKINGTYASENEYLLTDVLRDDWGFEGIVMTDWFAKQNAVRQVNAGNDLLEPGTKKQWNTLKKGAKNGDLSMEAVDASVKRILRLIFLTKNIDQSNEFGNNPDLEAHALITRNSATEGMILLKNKNTLPLKEIRNIALIGVTSFEFIAGGTGSGDVNEAYTISLEQGLTNSGYEINEMSKSIFEEHKLTHQEEFKKPEGMRAMMNPYEPPQIVYTDEMLAELASDSEMGIITIGRNSGEGGDRVEKDDFLLTDIEKEMISMTCEAFKKVGKKVAVILNIGGVIETSSWNEEPDAILLAWQGGQEGGNSVADILSGKVNPSGKLPMTFPVNLNDHASNANFPQEGASLNIKDMFMDQKSIPEEKQVKDVDYTTYEEGIYVGYRHFDKAELDVAYPFGFGLSYTDFELKDLDVEFTNDSIFVSLTVENLGDIAGKEVIQVYVSKPDSGIDRPVQELKAFSKSSFLEPGASEILSMEIPVSELSFWSEEGSKWELEEGNYEIKVGTSSRDIRLMEEIRL